MKEEIKEVLKDRHPSKCRDPIKCRDDFEFSVQASASHYCLPRDNKGPYTEVEVGFPSEVELLLMPYIERVYDGKRDDYYPNEEIATKTVYPFVPAEVILEVIDKHGGMVGGEIPSLSVEEDKKEYGL